ncbi:MAG: hypothetical protein ACI9YR_002125, partial [Bacteroidia bacterium]
RRIASLGAGLADGPHYGITKATSDAARSKGQFRGKVLPAIYLGAVNCVGFVSNIRHSILKQPQLTLGDSC